MKSITTLITECYLGLYKCQKFIVYGTHKCKDQKLICSKSLLVIYESGKLHVYYSVYCSINQKQGN